MGELWGDDSDPVRAYSRRVLTAYAAAVNRPAFVTSTVAELTGTPAATFRQWADDHVHDFLPRSPAKQ